MHFFFLGEMMIIPTYRRSFRRVTSTIFSADARFVMSGSDDGNVRIWKAKASEKLGVVTARERAAMEYRQSLKDRWRIDSEVDRVARLVSFDRYPYAELIVAVCCIAHAIYQNLSIRRRNSKRRCWRRGGLRTRGGENTPGLEKASQNPSEKRWSLPSRHDLPVGVVRRAQFMNMYCVGIIHCLLLGSRT
jgi:hypothetical protein